jgi:phospholipase C
MLRPLAVALLALGVLVPAGCSSHNPPSEGAASTLPAADSPTAGIAGQYIKHVIVIIQENRTFENFFAGYPGANAPMVGYAKDSSGHQFQVPLQQITFEFPTNLPHNWSAGIKMMDRGAMDGFGSFGKPGKYIAYSYVDQAQLAPYYAMASQYVLADEMFPTEIGPSYTAHLTLIAGTDNLSNKTALADFPSHPPEDCDAPPGTESTYIDRQRVLHWRTGPFPCYTQFRTMADTLDAAGISWKYYLEKVMNGGIWAPFEAIHDVRYGPDWNTDMGHPPPAILSDIAAGRLAAVNWVTPSKIDSDHPGMSTDRGPSWVGSIVNAIGESSYWNSTAIVVVWDDWGGWYDNAPPPQLDFRGLGIRVPCLIISPYAKQGYVSHTLYEFGSILKFIEQVYSLPPLGSTSEGYTDTRANSIIDSFDFMNQPRAFTPIQTPYKIGTFLHEKPSNAPVDE